MMRFNPRLKLTGKKATGYGLAFIMVFLVSTIMIGTSLQLVSAPVNVSYLGSSSQDNMAAQELAYTGMETVLTDIQSRLNSNQTVSTSYTYPTTSVTMPQDPSSLGGATATVGSYSATMTAARGDAYLVKVTATVGSGSASLSRLIHINRNTYPLDTISGASAAYSLRKLRSSYSGSAIRVVRPSDSAEQDIGFAPNGDLDVDSLKTFLGNTTPPLDTVTGAAAAYGLRKLRSAYTGSAIRVRRSSDSTEQDIGFTPGGDLDITALLDFVGTGSGYVKTWYDQSGNSKDASQSTTTLQPRIVNAGSLDTLSSGLPTVSFNGGQYLYNASISGTISGSKVTAFMVGQSNNSSSNNGRFVVLHKTGDANDYSTTSSIALFFFNALEGVSATSIVMPKYGNYYQYWGSGIAINQAFNAGFYIDGSSYQGDLNSIMETWGNSSGSMSSTLNLSPNYLILGTGRANSSFTSDYLTGALSEVIIYNTSLSYNSSRIPIEASEANYFNITGGPKYAAAPMPIYGLIKTWYDQSGNGKDLSQTTTASQPRIVLRNPNTRAGSRPALYFGGTDYLSRANGMPTSSDYSKSVVFSISDNSNWNDLIGNTGGQHSFYISSSSRTFRLSHATASTTYFTGGSSIPSLAVLYAALGTFTSSGGLGTIYMSNASDGTGTTGTQNTDASIAVGARGGTSTLNGSVSEAIIFSKVLSSSERTLLYNDQQSYYGAL